MCLGIILLFKNRQVRFLFKITSTCDSFKGFIDDFWRARKSRDEQSKTASSCALGDTAAYRIGGVTPSVAQREGRYCCPSRVLSDMHGFFRAGD